MSRGLGKLQTLIKHQVEADKVSTMESLRWKLYDKPLGPLDRLPSAWNINFRRAINSLIEKEVITHEERRLESIDEWEQHYPGKSLQNKIRLLRLTFIPVLATWLREDKGAHYNAAENERFILSGGRAHHQIFWRNEFPEELAKKWRALEPHVRAALAKTDAAPLVLLLARGKQLFEHYRIEVKTSLRESMIMLQKSGVLDADLASRIKTFVDEVSPETTVAQMNFKSLMRAIAVIPTKGAADLRDEAKNYLLEKKRNEVLAMPGTAIRERKMSPAWRNQVQYSPDMKRIVDHGVFQKYNFLTPRAAKR